MICQTCLRRLGNRQTSSVRSFASTTKRWAGTGQPSTPASRGPDRGSHEGPPAAISTSAAQPFSTQMNYVAEPPGTPSKVTETIKSSVVGGTALKGMGFMKNKEPPLAMEDHEYPDWLWGLLKTKSTGGSGSGNEEADIYAKTRRQRRAAAKAARKAAIKNPPSDMPDVSLEHQTIDLPSGDGTIEGAIQAIAARDELTGAMRKARRSSIKEANFLKGMR